MRVELAKLTFGDEGWAFVPLLHRLKGSFDNAEYEFMEQEEFHKLLGDKKAMEVYWREMLYRAHLAAVASLLRHEKWVSGVLNAAEDRNFLLFAAALRSLLESAADTDFALRGVPFALAEMSLVIELALSEELTTPVCSPELEDTLIHFSHGRRIEKGDDAPISHRARSAREYLKKLPGGEGGIVYRCYRDLCEIVHPAFASVTPFFSFDDSGYKMKVSTENDEALIRSFSVDYCDIWLPVFSLAVNTPLLILKVINRLPLESLHTSQLDKVSMKSLPAWQRIEDSLNHPKMPEGYPQ